MTNLDHSDAFNLFNVLHFTGDQALINRMLKEISYCRIPFTIDFDKILKTPNDILPDAEHELPNVYAYLTVASPFTKPEAYPEEYRGIEKYDEKTYKAICQTILSTPGFTHDDITEFIQCNGRWIDLRNKDDYPFIIQGKTYVDNILKYGAATRSDWRRKHWGSEWNRPTPIPAYTENALIFQTENDIRPLISVLSEKFPDIEIEYLWVDEEFSHCCGRYTYCNGTGTGSHSQIIARNLIADEIKYKYLGGYTSFKYDAHKHDYILSGENMRSKCLFELMQKNHALVDYDGYEYDYNKILP